MNKFLKIKKFYIFLIISLILNSIFFIHSYKRTYGNMKYIHEYYIENNTGKDIDNLTIGYHDYHFKETDSVNIKKLSTNSVHKGEIDVDKINPYNVYVKYTYKGEQRYLIYNLYNGEDYLRENFKIKLNIHTMDNEGYIYADYDNFHNSEVDSKNISIKK